MTAQLRMRQYQQQAVLSSTPEQLIHKLYDLGIAACVQEDRTRLRRVLTELMVGLNHENGGEVAQRLECLYEYCLNVTVNGDLEIVREILTGLREVWIQGIIIKKIPEPAIQSAAN